MLAHVLVATDAALRGLDCNLPAGLALLVSYDCPTRKVRSPAESCFTQRPLLLACQALLAASLSFNQFSPVSLQVHGQATRLLVQFQVLVDPYHNSFNTAGAWHFATWVLGQEL